MQVVSKESRVRERAWIQSGKIVNPTPAPKAIAKRKLAGSNEKAPRLEHKKPKSKPIRSYSGKTVSKEKHVLTPTESIRVKSAYKPNGIGKKSREANRVQKKQDIKINNDRLLHLRERTLFLEMIFAGQKPEDTLLLPDAVVKALSAKLKEEDIENLNFVDLNIICEPGCYRIEDKYYGIKKLDNGNIRVVGYGNKRPLTHADVAMPKRIIKPEFEGFNIYRDLIKDVEEVWFLFNKKLFKVNLPPPGYARMYRYGVVKDMNFGMKAIKPFLDPDDFKRVEVLFGLKSPFSEPYIGKTSDNYAFLQDILFFEKPEISIPKMCNLGKSHYKTPFVYTNPSGKKKMRLVTHSRALNSHEKYLQVERNLNAEEKKKIGQISRNAFSILLIHGAFDHIRNTKYSESYNYSMPLWEYVCIKIGNSTRAFDEEDIRYFIDCNIKESINYKSSKYSPNKLVCIKNGIKYTRLSKAEAEETIAADPNWKYAAKWEWKQVKSATNVDFEAEYGKPTSIKKAVKKPNKAIKFKKKVIPSKKKDKGLNKRYSRDKKIVKSSGKPRTIEFSPIKVISLNTLPYQLHKTQNKIIDKALKTAAFNKSKVLSNYEVMLLVKEDTAKLKEQQCTTDKIKQQAMPSTKGIDKVSQGKKKVWNNNQPSKKHKAPTGNHKGIETKQTRPEYIIKDGKVRRKS